MRSVFIAIAIVLFLPWALLLGMGEKLGAFFYPLVGVFNFFAAVLALFGAFPMQTPGMSDDTDNPPPPNPQP